MVMVRPMLYRGPTIKLTGRTFHFIGAADRTFGPIDVIYVSRGEGMWLYAVIREGTFHQLVEWTSREAVVLMEEMNVRMDYRGCLVYDAPEDGERRSYPVSEVPERHLDSMGPWVRAAVGRP